MFPLENRFHNISDDLKRIILIVINFMVSFCQKVHFFLELDLQTQTNMITDCILEIVILQIYQCMLRCGMLEKVNELNRAMDAKELHTHGIFGLFLIDGCDIIIRLCDLRLTEIELCYTTSLLLFFTGKCHIYNCYVLARNN